MEIITKKRVLISANYIINNETTISQTAKALNLEYQTVKTDINGKLPAIDVQLYVQVVAILSELKTRKLDNLNSRVLEVGNYINDNNATVLQTSKALNLTEQIIYADINNRLSNLNPQLFAEVRKTLIDVRYTELEKAKEKDKDKSTLQIANYIISNNCDIRQARIHFKLEYNQTYYMLHTRLPKIDAKLFNQVDTVLKNLQEIPYAKRQIKQAELKEEVELSSGTKIGGQQQMPVSSVVDEFIYNADGLNKQGYDKDGYNKQGFNTKGFNAKGFDIKGYNAKGYNVKGQNKYRFDIDGNEKKY